MFLAIADDGEYLHCWIRWIRGTGSLWSVQKHFRINLCRAQEFFDQQILICVSALFGWL